MVQTLEKQGLALRGHRESSDVSYNQAGNFPTLVHEIAQCSTLLKNHVENSLRKDVKYLRPKSQNELIDIIGKKLIQRRIIQESSIVVEVIRTVIIFFTKDILTS